jgi:IS30 family transposase
LFIISTGKFWVTSGSIFGFHKKGFDNENPLGLIRQYPPKDMSLSPWSQKDLDENAQLLNIRPKKN